MAIMGWIEKKFRQTSSFTDSQQKSAIRMFQKWTSYLLFSVLSIIQMHERRLRRTRLSNHGQVRFHFFLFASIWPKTALHHSAWTKFDK